MRSIKIMSLAAVAGTLALTPLRADQWDKKTTITINTPVQIPSTTLQPGTYTLKLLDSSSDRHIVTVWDKDGMHLITTVLAIPNYRLTPTGKSKFSFWESAVDHPAALRAWFYPGDNFGQEFAYPKAQAQQLSMTTHSQIPTLSAQDEGKYGGSIKGEATQMAATEAAAPTKSEVETRTVTPEPEPTPVPVAAAPAPAASTTTVTPEPAPASTTTAEPAPASTTTAEPAATPATATEQTPAAAPEATSMPATASNWNETMALGLLFGLTGLATFIAGKKAAS